MAPFKVIVGSILHPHNGILTLRSLGKAFLCFSLALPHFRRKHPDSRYSGNPSTSGFTTTTTTFQDIKLEETPERKTIRRIPYSEKLSVSQSLWREVKRIFLSLALYSFLLKYSRIVDAIPLWNIAIIKVILHYFSVICSIQILDGEQYWSNQLGYTIVRIETIKVQFSRLLKIFIW